MHNVLVRKMCLKRCCDVFRITGHQKEAPMGSSIIVPSSEYRLGVSVESAYPDALT